MPSEYYWMTKAAAANSCPQSSIAIGVAVITSDMTPKVDAARAYYDDVKGGGWRNTAASRTN